MTRKGLRTPRTAAIAGILFALLLSASIVLIKLSIASNPVEAGKWLVEGDRRVSVIVAVNLVPFAGIAFLWFMGVIRDRQGARRTRADGAAQGELEQVGPDGASRHKTVPAPTDLKTGDDPGGEHRRF
jgi:hypothetical protein